MVVFVVLEFWWSLDLVCFVVLGPDEGASWKGRGSVAGLALLLRA